jgi:cation diffusion facilitator CzcD-associated flavoprotein CzcO
MKQQQQRTSQGPSAGRHRIVIAGAGPGGICTAIKLKQAGVEDFVILERSSAAGGTWHNNRYPGLSCDVPSHLYSFSFEPKPDWTRAFATQPEIKDYMLHCVEKYGVAAHIRYNAAVTQAQWDEPHSQWRITTADGTTLVADYFISALGMFNEIQWPDIAGLKDFKGELIHTAAWPEGADLRGKRVAVIGSAASATQMIPEIAQEVQQLYVYQRTANWVLPKDDKTYTAEELEQMRRQPELGLEIRKMYWGVFEQLVTFSEPVMMEDLRRRGLENLNTVTDPETRRKLYPQLPLGAQRPLFSNEFYPTFNRPNVELITDPVESIGARGVRSGGAERGVDTIILATGYAANKYLSVIDVTGRGGVRLKDAWSDGPQAYLGMTTSGFPNLFMLYGPNTNNGSILYMLELQVDYILRKLRHMWQNGIDWIDVRPEVQAEYNRKVQEEIYAVEAWRTLGSKYYRTGSGRIVTQWPHNMAVFEERTKAPDDAAFEMHGADRSSRASIAA